MKNKLSRLFSRNSLLYLDLDQRIENTIFLAGTGRSGTTWMSAIINYQNDFRYLFEPFHSKRVSLCRNFRYRQYLRPENKERQFLEPCRKILEGRVRNLWVDSQNRKFLACKRLIKDIRANLLLKWIKHNFPCIPIILLIRHPCAVAYSKIKLHWKTHLDVFLAQDDLVVDFLLPFSSIIHDTKDIFAQHILMWCIENYIPLKQFKKGEICIVFYEDLCLNPDQEVARVFDFLRRDYDDGVQLAIERPSTRARKHSAITTGSDLINAWKKHIAKEDYVKARSILDLFELGCLYDDCSVPDKTILQGFLSKEQ